MATPSPLSTRLTASMMSLRRSSTSSSGPMVTASIWPLRTDDVLQGRAELDSQPPVGHKHKTNHETPRGRVPGAPHERVLILTIRSPSARGIFERYLSGCCIAVAKAPCASRPALRVGDGATGNCIRSDVGSIKLSAPDRVPANLGLVMVNRSPIRFRRRSRSDGLESIAVRLKVRSASTPGKAARPDATASRGSLCHRFPDHCAWLLPAVARRPRPQDRPPSRPRRMAHASSRSRPTPRDSRSGRPALRPAAPAAGRCGFEMNPVVADQPRERKLPGAAPPRSVPAPAAICRIPDGPRIKHGARADKHGRSMDAPSSSADCSITSPAGAR